MTRDKDPGHSSLRKRAEAILAKNPRETPLVPTLDVQALIYELEVHQIELEMQNQELQQSQAALGMSRDRFAELYEFAPVGFLTLGPAAAILEANLAAATLLGVDRGKLTGGRRFVEFVDPQARDAWLLFHRHALEQTGKQACELALRAEQGRALTVRVECLPMPGDAGHEAHCLLAVIDVTERKTVQNKLERLNRELESRIERRTAQLRDSEQRLNLALTAAQMGTWDRDLRTDHLTVNGQWLEMLGFEPGQVQPTHAAWQALVHPEDWPRVQAALAEHMDGRTPLYECEYRMRTRTGEWRWVESRGRVVERDAQGRPQRLTGTHRDVTTRRTAQEMLDVYQHNLRSLANQMVTVEERERRRLAVDLHDGPSQLLVAAQMRLGVFRNTLTNSDQAAVLREIGQLLTQAIHGLGTLTFELCPPVLHDLGLVPAVKWLAEDMERRYWLGVKVEDDGKPKAMDAHRSTVVFRCLRELLANVAKHAKMKEALVTLRRKEDLFVATVEDKGVGFTQAFDPGKALHTPGRGGFGLFSIHERLTQLGGRMEVCSIAGQGTVVTVTLPLEPSPISAPEKP